MVDLKDSPIGDTSKDKRSVSICFRLTEEDAQLLLETGAHINPPPYAPLSIHQIARVAAFDRIAKIKALREAK